MRRFLPPPSRLRAVIRGLAIGLLAVSLAACALFEKKPEQLAPDEPADRLYNEGLTLVAKKEYKDASKKFEEIDRQHPYSEWARKALLMTAYVKYEAGEYEESITAAKRYVTLHPGSPDAAYALYLVGASYFDQIADITRDQARTERAIQALDEVVRKYPDSEYAESARRKITIARDQLAGKEMSIGRYYQEKRNYIGAINRFKTVVVQYQTTRQVEEALMRLVECYMAMGITQEAQTAAAVLGHNFPDSPWYKDAYKLLQTGGLEPREDKSSWISRAFKKLGLG
ncbi:outer membrane protein assembly factor BamD [Blastochloris sulfoviridis]|uniref:Outer membrane protein assembly factor BamD n=1 Tax=Blastochloris sulfoviridis TaxID=50712 RepID=A0A5M6I3D0_9HYPH|nr:outer membrane protein assembly factor BamD [Blastochloris sulfoviridis]KAA5602308.1 outer membrane protein assembly factor BamD [Blastochloris sulfoviridis]